MEKDKSFQDILMALGDKDLRCALDKLATEAAATPTLADNGRLSRARESYELMLDYWGRGYDDPHLQSVVQGLVKEVYAIAANMELKRLLATSPRFIAMRRGAEASGRDWSPSALKGMLEGYVSDVAMTELDPPHIGAKKRLQIQADHRREMSLLFDYLATSEQWEAGMVEPMLHLLLSPTVDTIDQQLMVAAITINTTNVFDLNKFRLLTQLYRQSTDEAVRQRALVGWATSLGWDYKCLFEEESQEIQALLADEATVRELVELQIQMIYCINAETDHRTIQEKIMPDLLRNGGLNITQGGIYESDADPEDLLHPEEAESRMERLEASINRMADMQKAGVDVYFGSFSQMKRFSFFHNMSNWFVPFYMEHPEIADVVSRPEDAKILANIMRHVPFCDSDKYSFVLAFSQVAQRLPQAMREMLSTGAMMPPEMATPQDSSDPAFVRRIYLQNLYRFYRCHPERSNLHDPFDRENYPRSYLFFSHRLFSDTPLQAKFCQVISCLLKREMNEDAVTLFENFPIDTDDFQYYVMAGWFLLNHPNLTIATLDKSISECFLKALEIHPDDNTALLGYARALFKEESYDKAANVYARLLDKHPDNTMYQLNICACMVNQGQCTEALNTLYKLNYEHPTDQRVQRVMARALMGSNQLDKAAKIYGELTSTDKALDEDILFAGYCQWLMRHRKEAAKLFARYLRPLTDNSQYDEYRWQFFHSIGEREEQLLSDNGIGDNEINLMNDLTYDVSFEDR